MFNVETNDVIFVCYTKNLIGGVLDGIKSEVRMEIPDEESSRVHWQMFAEKHDTPKKPVNPCVGKQKYWISDFRFEK